jgi:hypothetical protein
VLSAQLDLLEKQNEIASQIARNRNTDTESKLKLESDTRGLEYSRVSVAYAVENNNLSLQRLKNADAIADVEAQIGLIQGNNNAAAAYASLQALKNTHKILHAERELAELQRNPGATSGDVVGKRRELIELERKVLADNYNNQKAAIMAQGSNAKAALAAQKASVDRQKETIDKEIAFKSFQITRENALFREETKNITAKIQADIEKATRDKDIIEQTRKLEQLKIDNAKTISDQQYEAVKNQLLGYSTFAESTNAFNDGIATFATVIAELLGVAGDPAAKAAIEASALGLPEKIKTDIATTIAAAEETKMAYLQNKLAS